MSRLCSRAFLFRPPWLYDPEASVNVVEVNQSMVWLSSPRERQVGPEPLWIAGPQPPDLPSLPVKLTAQLARNIKDPAATVIVAHAQDIVFDPDVVRARFRHAVFGDLPRMFYVRHFYHVSDTPDRNALLVIYVEFGRKYLIGYEYVILIAKDRMRSGQPSVTIKLVMVEAELTDELRVLRASALDPFSHVQDHKSIPPVRKVSQAVLDVDVMQVSRALVLGPVSD